VGPVGFDDVGSGKVILVLDSDDKIPDFSKLTSIIKKEGASRGYRSSTPGPILIPSYWRARSHRTVAHLFPVFQTHPREMTLDDIRETQEGFVKAAVRAKEAASTAWRSSPLPAISSRSSCRL